MTSPWYGRVLNPKQKKLDKKAKDTIYLDLLHFATFGVGQCDIFSTILLTVLVKTIF